MVLFLGGDPTPPVYDGVAPRHHCVDTSALRSGIWTAASVVRAGPREGIDNTGHVRASCEDGHLRVGILAQGVFWKGLFRDVEIVTWALTSPHCHIKKQPRVEVSIFYTKLYKTAEAAVAINGTYAADELDTTGSDSLIHRLCVPQGTDIREWLGTLDVFITFESPLLTIFQLAIEKGAMRVVLVLNVDWAVDKELQLLSARLPIDRFDFWVKGPATQLAIQEVLARQQTKLDITRNGSRASNPADMVQRVPWTIPDDVVLRRSPPVDSARMAVPVTFLMIVGMGGVQSRRGVDIALRAFHLAMEAGGAGANLQMLLSTTLYPFPVEPHLLDHPNVTVLYQVHTREELVELVGEADAVLNPSRWEGFGLTIMEALHAGVPVISTDGWPMNELVHHEANGLLVEAKNLGPFVAEDHMCNIREFEPTSCREMLSPHWEVEEQALARAILRFATARELRQRVTAPDPWALKARQRAFSLVSRRLLQSRRPPSALVVTIEDAPDRLPVASPGAGRHRGSIDARYCEDEEDEAPKLMCFVREGLRQNGYEVRQVSGETAEDEDGAGQGPELVVLIGSNTNATAVHSRSNAGVERWFGRLRSRVADGVMVWWDGSSGEEMALTGQACADAMAQGVDVCVSENADVGAPWRLGAKESRGLSPGDMRCWSLLLSIPRSRRRPAAAVGELLALVSASARAEMSAVCRIEHTRARLLAFYTTAGRILEKAGMVEAAAGKACAHSKARRYGTWCLYLDGANVEQSITSCALLSWTSMAAASTSTNCSWGACLHEHPCYCSAPANPSWLHVLLGLPFCFGPAMAVMAGCREADPWNGLWIGWRQIR